MVKFQFQERGLIGFLLQMTLSKNCDVKEPEGGGEESPISTVFTADLARKDIFCSFARTITTPNSFYLIETSISGGPPD